MSLPFLAGGSSFEDDKYQCLHFNQRSLALAKTTPKGYDQGTFQAGKDAIAYLAQWRQHHVPAKDLYEGYIHGGSSYLSGLRGSFIIAIRTDDQWHLIRDRAGFLSLYYTKIHGKLFFSNQPQWLWDRPGFKKQLCPGSIARYFTYSFQPGESTMLENLHKVPAASILTFTGDSIETLRHYEHETSAQCPWEDNQSRNWEHEFNTSFQRAVSLCIDQGGDPGAFLSGGLDSSLVAAEVQRQTSTKLNTFSLHFGKEYANELEYAKIVANHIGSEHHEIELKPKGVLDKLAHLVSLLDDPIGDPVTLGNYEMARQIGERPMFNGEGGDPCFGGPKNIPMMLESIYDLNSGESFSKERAYLRSYRRAFEEFPRFLSEDLWQQINHTQDLIKPISPYFHRKHDSRLRELLELNQMEKGANLILPKVAQLQGHFGIQPLSPLFDEDLIHWSMTLPTSLILNHGVEKIILKKISNGLLPDIIINRAKSGMRVPVYYWFKGPLKKYARKILSPKRLKACGLYNTDRIQKILKMDTEEKGGRYGIWLWMLLTFEMWRTKVIEGESL